MTMVAHSSSMPFSVALLWVRGWPPAAQFFWSRIGDIESVPLEDLAADFWSGERERCRAACLTLADLLFAAGCGDEALAALMLAADPAAPHTFETVLPALAYAIEHFWDWPTARVTRHHTLDRLAVWWSAARGDFKDNGSSIFWITQMEMLDQDDPSAELPPEDGPNESEQENKPEVTGIVVMPSNAATKLNNFHAEFTDLVDAKLPLRLAGDIGAVRRKLVSEFPHAVGAIDLVLRDLREGKPVRWTPILLTGPVGVGKSFLVQKIADALGIGCYRYDGAGASDAMFGGSPKAWGNTVSSAPVRAINIMRIANPILLTEEIEKAGTSSRNGRLWDVMLVYLDRKTAARVRDVSLDAVVDCSWILHIATANSIEDLPNPLRDRFRIVRVPAPRLADLPQLAANVLLEIAVEAGEQGFVLPLAGDELAVIGRAWEKAGFSLRALQRIVTATLEARNATAARH